MKFKVFAHLDFYDDVVEVDDNLTKEEIEQELKEYVSCCLAWYYEQVEEEK